MLKAVLGLAFMVYCSEPPSAKYLYAFEHILH